MIETASSARGPVNYDGIVALRKQEQSENGGLRTEHGENKERAEWNVPEAHKPLGDCFTRLRHWLRRAASRTELSRLRRNFFDRINKINMIFLFSL